MMEFWQNIPMLLVVFSLMSAAICSVLPGKVARVWLTAATGLACAASAFFLAKMLGFEARPTATSCAAAGWRPSWR